MRGYELSTNKKDETVWSIEIPNFKEIIGHNRRTQS